MLTAAGPISMWPLILKEIAQLLYKVAGGVAGGVQEGEREAKDLVLKAQILHKSISTTFYWPKQVLRPTMIEDPALDGSICREFVTISRLLFTENNFLHHIMLCNY